MTLPEVLLWTALRKRRTGGLRFRRQHPVGPYVLDFYCDAMKVAVEVDGEAHSRGDRPQRDHQRDRWLSDHGVATVRLPAADVLRSPDDAARSAEAEIHNIGYLRTLEAQLTEWDTPEDAAAFDDL